MNRFFYQLNENQLDFHQVNSPEIILHSLDSIFCVNIKKKSRIQFSLIDCKLLQQRGTDFKNRKKSFGIILEILVDNEEKNYLSRNQGFYVKKKIKEETYKIFNQYKVPSEFFSYGNAKESGYQFHQFFSFF